MVWAVRQLHRAIGGPIGPVIISQGWNSGRLLLLHSQFGFRACPQVLTENAERQQDRALDRISHYQIPDRNHKRQILLPRFRL